MPWLGKSFDAQAAHGYNRLAPSARWPAKLFWPLYGTKPEWERGRRSTSRRRSSLERPTRTSRCLKIDYGPVESNPRFIIRQIRDELVELVPDTYLGKILWRSGEERYTGASATSLLRQPAGGLRALRARPAGGRLEHGSPKRSARRTLYRASGRPIGADLQGRARAPAPPRAAEGADQAARSARSIYLRGRCRPGDRWPSMGGSHRHPVWWLNLRESPRRRAPGRRA